MELERPVVVVFCGERERLHVLRKPCATKVPYAEKVALGPRILLLYITLPFRVIHGEHPRTVPIYVPD